MAATRPTKTSVTYLRGSGWVDRPFELEAPLVGDVSCDVAVIGGGLGGMLAALRLAELGRDVVLVERDVCGWAASGRNAGYVTNTLGNDPRILKRFYKDRVRGLYRFANNAVGFTEDLIASRGIECGYLPTGNIGAARSAAAFRRMQRTMKSGKRSVVADAETLGIPRAFYGGIHIKIGGTLNPGEFALGVRDEVRTSPVRVFEQSEVRDVTDLGDSVRVELAAGTVAANQVILTTNAGTGELDIAPGHLATPVWTTAVETEPVSDAQLDEAGWTSRTPITTNHYVMQSFRTTNRGTLVTTTRRLQMPRKVEDRVPSKAVVGDLLRGLHARLPTLKDVGAARAWGGWIAVTPSNMAVVGQVTPRVFYSLACNGHGLPQAPYLGSLLADHVSGKQMHDDLAAVWRTKDKFAPGIVSPLTLRLGWTGDRFFDGIDRLRHRSR